MDGNTSTEPSHTHTETSGKKMVRIYKSFAEQAEDEARDIIKMPPVERVRYTVELIIRVYGFTREQLNSRTQSRRINFILPK